MGSLSPSTRKMINKAAQQVFNIPNTGQYDMKPVNGWMLGVNFGRYGTDYQTRAFVAFVGLGALPIKDAAYPSAIERYGILSSMPLRHNADGSLDIYIQGKSPGADNESNWLPTPPGGPFNLSVRVYQAKKELYDGRTENNLVVEAGSYAFPPVVKVP